MRFSSSRRGPYIFFIPFGGLFVLISIGLAAFFVHEFAQVQSYQTGQCLITAKQLLQEEQEQTETNDGNTYKTLVTVYKPDFVFTVQTADHHSYQAQGYDILQTSSSDRSGQQAIIDQFTIGKTYPCWYNPAYPTQAVLTRELGWLVFFLPSLFFFIGGVFMVIGIVLIPKCRRETTVVWTNERRRR